MWVLRQGNIDVGVIKETKLTDRIHARQGEGYSIWATWAEIKHRGGIEVVWRDEAGWQVEGIANFVPNTASFFLTSGLQRWYVVGAYMPPHDTPAVHRIKQAL